MACEAWTWISDVLGCVSYSGTGHLVNTDVKMNAAWIHQPESCAWDPKHEAESTLQWLQQKKEKVITVSWPQIWNVQFMQDDQKKASSTTMRTDCKLY